MSKFDLGCDVWVPVMDIECSALRKSEPGLKIEYFDGIPHVHMKGRGITNGQALSLLRTVIANALTGRDDIEELPPN